MKKELVGEKNQTQRDAKCGERPCLLFCCTWGSCLRSSDYHFTLVPKRLESAASSEGESIPSEVTR